MRGLATRSLRGDGFVVLRRGFGCTCGKIDEASSYIKQEVDEPLEGKEITDEEVQAAYDANPTEFDLTVSPRLSR